MEARGEDGVDGLPFSLQIFSSETTNCNIPIFVSELYKISDCESFNPCSCFEKLGRDQSSASSSLIGPLTQGNIRITFILS